MSITISVHYLTSYVREKKSEYIYKYIDDIDKRSNY